MIDIEVPIQRAEVDRVVQHLALTARCTGLSAAEDLLEALRVAMAERPMRLADPRR